MEDFPIWMKLTIYGTIGGTVIYAISVFVYQTFF
jgi:hypothetical protein